MGVFSLISIANEDEFMKGYGALNILSNKFKEHIINYLPSYVSGVIDDIGIPGYDVKGCRVLVPPIKEEGEAVQKRIKKAIQKAKALSAEVIVFSSHLSPTIRSDDLDIRISKGTIYPPYVFIDALKAVSALMGINFSRCNICIADASNQTGLIMTELLLDEALYLTLFTDEKEIILQRLDKFILKSGLSPAVVSNGRKAMESCDILIYTGDADLQALTSYVNKKVLVANLIPDSISITKDILMFNEVILKGQNEPVISENVVGDKIFLTSRVWEGALLTLSDIDTKKPSAKKSFKLGNLSKQMGLEITSVMNSGRVINKELIYRYR